MRAIGLINRLRRSLRNFPGASSGNVTMTFTLAVLPIIGFVGAAVDYSRGNSAKAAMQAANDSMALMLSKDAQNLTSAQLSQKANDYFNALFNRTEVSNLNIAPTFSQPQQGNFKLTVDVTGNVPTMFMRIFGQQQMNLAVNSEVVWGIKKLELALALDNTGSMSSSGKMTALKTATKNLLKVLKDAAKVDGDVKVAIIPFDTTVRIGTSYKDQPWFDIDSAMDCNGWLPGTGCTSANWKDYWKGCVRDRTYPYDTQDNSPDPNVPATLYPVDDCGSLAVAMPLSYDWTALNAKVDEMTPNGNTNVTIGLVWAWHALTQNTPYTQAATATNNLDKVIIILTDGDNTESWKNSSSQKVTSSSAIDIRTALACTNIKAAGVRIYAVRVINGNATLLRNCASNPTMYYDVQQASQLNSVFTAIAQNLANLRIAK
ncbi:MAG: VWA domain-containing protein [Hyphomicrobiales bacterium]|nr:VWA domain-containing protein [Hyphomicrobiales bacterium]